MQYCHERFSSAFDFLVCSLTPTQTLTPPLNNANLDIPVCKSMFIKARHSLSFIARFVVLHVHIDIETVALMWTFAMKIPLHVVHTCTEYDAHSQL